jgi:hypothetical protein
MIKKCTTCFHHVVIKIRQLILTTACLTSLGMERLVTMQPGLNALVQRRGQWPFFSYGSALISCLWHANIPRGRESAVCVQLCVASTLCLLTVTLPYARCIEARHLGYWEDWEISGPKALFLYNVFGTYSIKKPTHVKRCILIKCRGEKIFQKAFVFWYEVI